MNSRLSLQAEQKSAASRLVKLVSGTHFADEPDFPSASPVKYFIPMPLGWAELSELEVLAPSLLDLHG
jgi:hypothetical protein